MDFIRRKITTIKIKPGETIEADELKKFMSSKSPLHEVQTNHVHICNASEFRAILSKASNTSERIKRDILLDLIEDKDDNILTPSINMMLRSGRKIHNERQIQPRAELDDITEEDEDCSASAESHQDLERHMAQHSPSASPFTDEDAVVAATTFQPGSLHIQDFIGLQQKDDYCRDITEQIATGHLKKQFRVHKGVLIRLNMNTIQNKMIPSPQIVLPTKLIDLVIKQHHTGTLGTHVPARRVHLTMARKFHYPEMEKRIKDVIAECTPCAINNYYTKKKHKMSVTTTSNIPRHTIGIDIAPDIPPHKGYNHIVLFVDFASNWIFLKPIKRRTSQELLQAFQALIAVCGVPSTIRHDQEKGLVEGAFKEFCDSMKIQQITGLPHKGQTNGRVESQIRNVKYQLRSLTTAKGTKMDWSDELWRISSQINSAVSTATRLSPEMIMFGHELQNHDNPIGINMNLHTDNSQGPGTVPFLVRTQAAEQTRATRQNSQLMGQNKNLRDNEYQEGQLVWRIISQHQTDGGRKALSPSCQKTRLDNHFRKCM